MKRIDKVKADREVMMRRSILPAAVVAAALLLAGCGSGDGDSGEGPDSNGGAMKIAFLHHSTGKVIWDGGVRKWFKKYNKSNSKKYEIKEIVFPKEKPYGWNNYPYDYWKIWVDNAGSEMYMEEPTLELLAGEYGMIIFKHCFPVSNILPDTGNPDVASSEKRLENYRAQYDALKEKFHQMPETKFLVWTAAALVEASTDEERGRRAREFAEWVRNEWDEPGDNIFVWDFFELETEGGLFLREDYAKSARDSHPNKGFAKKAAPALCQRIVDVLEGRVE